MNNKFCEMPLKSNDQLITFTAPALSSTEQQKHYVVHNYHDHSQDIPFHLLFFNDKTDSHDLCTDTSTNPKTFPMKLQELLDNAEAEGHEHIISSWQLHGRAFLLHKKKEFFEIVLPRYFGRIQLLSFKRQLNLYDFKRITQGPDRDAYYHELLLRGLPFSSSCIPRKRAKGMKIKLAANPEAEPTFYLMPFLPGISCTKKVNPKSVTLPESASEIFLDSAKSSTYRQRMSPIEITISSLTVWDHEDDSRFSEKELAFMNDLFFAVGFSGFDLPENTNLGLAVFCYFRLNILLHINYMEF